MLLEAGVAASDGVLRRPARSAHLMLFAVVVIRVRLPSFRPAPDRSGARAGIQSRDSVNFNPVKCGTTGPRIKSGVTVTTVA